MRHSNSGRKLSRTPAHRKALLHNLAKALLIHGKIRTTEMKAKELRRVVEPLITLAKRKNNPRQPPMNAGARRLSPAASAGCG